MKNKIIRQYYVLSGLLSYCGLSLLSAVYVTYLIQSGLNLLQVNIVNSTFFLTLFICEIPTGAFADIFGRKISFVLSCLLLAVAKIVYGSSSTLSWFIVAEMLAALAFTFQNGAFQAWLVDNLKHHGYEGELMKIFGRQTLICQICGALGAISGSYLYSVQPSLPWFAGALMLIILAIVASKTMSEEYFKKARFSISDGLRSMRETAIKSIHYGVNHKSVRFVLVITFVQILANQSLNMYWQPFFKGKGLAEVHFGFFFSGIMAAVALGAYAASKVNTANREKCLVIITQVTIGIVVITMSFTSTLYMGIVMYLVHEIPRGFWKPVVDSYLQKRIPSDERATISSFCSVAPHIGGVVGLVISGIIAEYTSINTAWLFSGIILIVGTLLVARNGTGSSD